MCGSPSRTGQGVAGFGGNRHVTDVALRARIALWAGEGRRRKDIAELTGVSQRTVDGTKARYAEHRLAGWRKRGAAAERTRCTADPRPRDRTDQDAGAGAGPDPSGAADESL
ncbi:helix-turn-helix domain-containing protein [Streptomyces sp. NPDC047028]|uniref:helix-turn-helix domain-containing protein n=1 Tax=Streptomyces sp. NPDC047028 TaxID=3155793 RepID=UPI003400A72E